MRRLLSRCVSKVAEVQSRFLHKLEVTANEAFLDYNFAPTVLRRNIRILGLLHKRVLGLCLPSFEQLLPWYSDRFDIMRGFGHNKQLYGHWLGATQHRALWGRSIFKMVDIYNNLPQWVVDSQSVTVFRKSLTKIARDRCQMHNESWASSFCCRDGPDTSLWSET